MRRHVNLARGESLGDDFCDRLLSDDDFCQVRVLPLGGVARSVANYDMWFGGRGFLFSVGALLEVGFFYGAGSAPFEGGSLGGR